MAFQFQPRVSASARAGSVSSLPLGLDLVQVLLERHLGGVLGQVLLERDLPLGHRRLQGSSP